MVQGKNKELEGKHSQNVWVKLRGVELRDGRKEWTATARAAKEPYYRCLIVPISDGIFIRELP